MLPTKTYVWRLLLATIAFTAAIACSGADEGDEPGNGLSQPTVGGSRRTPNVSPEEAQRLVDFPIAQPAEVPRGVSLKGVLVSTSFQDPERVDNIELLFSGAGYSFRLMESDRGKLTIGGSTQPILIGGVQGEMRRRQRSDGRPLMTVAWTSGELSFIATAFLTDELTEEAFLTILESVP